MRASSVVPLALLFNQLVDEPVKNRFEPNVTQHQNWLGYIIMIHYLKVHNIVFPKAVSIFQCITMEIGLITAPDSSKGCI